MEELEAKARAERAQETQLMKLQAIRVATFEILSEQKAEIVKRASAKLVAMGITVEAGDINEQEIS